MLERTQDILFATPARRTVKALQREYAFREQIEPKGPPVRLLHLAYQAASHELATKTFDFSPSSIADRRAAGERDMSVGLRVLREEEDLAGRFHYWSIDTERAAELGASGASKSELVRAA